MASARLQAVLLQVRRLLAAPAADEQTDRQLLNRFANDRDEAAFATLVHRHGPLVLGVGRRLLRQSQDAEDVLQATFLVLARKGASRRWQESVAGWLYRVAYRLAADVKAKTAMQRKLEREAGAMLRTEAMPEQGQQELHAVLDEELQRLPEKYREPLLLCYLEGQTRGQAAQRLGWSVRTLHYRLERGLGLLRKRLTARGVGLPVALLTVGLSQQAASAAVSSALAATMARAAVAFAAGPSLAGGGITVEVAGLAEGAVNGMVIGKVKFGLALIFAVGLATAGGAVAFQVLPARQANQLAGSQLPGEKMPPLPPERGIPSTRVDQHGDPLPVGALARLGTVRLRHGNGIYAASISPDGKLVASTGGHQITYVWDAITGKRICGIAGPQIRANDAIAFSPDGKELAVGGLSGVYLCDPKTGAVRSHLKAAQTFSIAFSVDGKLIATGHESAGTSIWDAASGEKLFQFEAKPSGQESRTLVWSVVFSPDGKTLASAVNGKVVLWDLPSRQQRHELKGDPEYVFAVAFSPDNSRLATGGRDRTIRLWEAASGKLLQQFQGHEDAVASLAFSREGKTLVSGSGAGSHKSGAQRTERAALRLWDVATGRETARLGDHGEGVVSLGFSKDGRTLMSAGGGSMRLWDFASRQEIHTFGGHHAWVGSLAFTQDGKILATGGGDNTVRLWSVPSGRQIQELSGLKADVDGLVFSPKGNLVIAGSRDGGVLVWDSVTGKEKRRHQAEEAQYSIAMSSDGRTLASGTWKGTVFLWDMGTGHEVRRLPARKEYDAIHSLSFSPNGQLLAATVFNQSDFRDSFRNNEKPGCPVRLWDIKQGISLQPLIGHEGPTMCVAFSPDGKRIVSASWDGTVRLWETATRRQVWQYRPNARSLKSVAFSPDGRQVVCAGHTDTIFVCDVASGKESCRITGPQTSVTSVAFSPNGKIIASAAMDSTILLWDAELMTAKLSKPAESTQTDDNLKSFWTDLAGQDAARAHEAVWGLIGASSRAVASFNQRLRPVKLDAKQTDKLIANLDSDKFSERQKATEDLANLGDLAAPMLRQAQLGHGSVEKRRRLDDLLRLLENRVPAPEELRRLRAIEVLEYIGTAQARQTLMMLAQGDAASRTTQEAKSSLDRLANRTAVVP